MNSIDDMILIAEINALIDRMNKRVIKVKNGILEKQPKDVIDAAYELQALLWEERGLESELKSDLEHLITITLNPLICTDHQNRFLVNRKVPMDSNIRMKLYRKKDV